MDSNKFPYYFENLSQADEELVKTNFGESSLCRDLVRIKEKGSDNHLQTVSRRFLDHAELVYNMEVREDDIWVVTYPKCGTTWTQEIVWNIVNGVQVERIKEPLFGRSPFIDIPMIDNKPDRNPKEFFSFVDKMPSPRVIKSHYPFELLPPKLLETCKVIFVCRNVKDACVSYYHHNLLIKSFAFDSAFKHFADLYMKNNILQGGYFEMLQSGWKRKENPNMLFFWYEEIKQDQKLWIKKIMDHIGYTLEEEKVTELNEAMTFGNYKKISSMNAMKGMFNEGKGEFTRKGVVGDWVNYFDGELNQTWNGWIQKNLESLGITEDERVAGYFDTT